MTFSTFLIKQLTDFVNVYRQFFKKTFVASLLMSFFCCVCMAVLLKFSDFDKYSNKQISLLSYFISRYSAGETYSLVDLSKIFLLFFVSLFSIGLTRFEGSLKSYKGDEIVPFNLKISAADIVYFLLILIVCSVLDYGVFRIYAFFYEMSSSNVQNWIYSEFFQLRIYMPLVIFSFALYKRSAGHSSEFGWKNLLFLLASLWLFNEFGYELILLARIHVFKLMLIPTEGNSTFIVESLLVIPVMALLFLGYHSAMYTSLTLLNESESSN
jgi:hypothetical protein